MNTLFSIVKGHWDGLESSVHHQRSTGHSPVVNGHGLERVVNGQLDKGQESGGNNFLRQMVDLILDECHIVGDRDLVKENNHQLVHFLQPKQLENELKLKIGKKGSSDQELLELCRKTIKFSVKTNHPYFYNQLYAGIDEYGLAGSWLTDALNTSQATYEISPVFTIMEKAAMKYFGSLIGWPQEDTDGILTPGGSLANIYGIILARHRMFPECKQKGLQGMDQIVMFASDGSHYSFVKGFIWMGMGSDSVIKVKTDHRGKMIPEVLEEAILMAKKEGKIPLMVACTSGTTVLGAFDPLRPIGLICQKYDLWMHVDGALGGTVLMSRKYRHLLDGIELADSMTWNLHKLAGVPLQCSAFITRQPTALIQANCLNAEYLFQNDKYYDASYDTGDKGVQCGRKVDSLKMWLSLAARGEEELEKSVDAIFDVVEYAMEVIKKRPGFYPVLPEMECNNVCFWYLPVNMRPTDGMRIVDIPKLNQICPLIKGRMMEGGDLMINYQPLTSKGYPNFFRLVLTCIPRSTKADIDFIVEKIEEIGKEIVI